jgi:hypothetical protein
MHAHQLLLLPTSPAELERILRAAADGTFPEASHGARPPVLALQPLLRPSAREVPPASPLDARPAAERPRRTRVAVAPGAASGG